MDWIIKYVDYYMGIAQSVGQTRKKCYSRNIGTVLVRDDTIIATGFNGPPRGIPMCDEWGGNWSGNIEKIGAQKKDIKGICPRRVMSLPSGTGLEYCPAVHAERNALLMCAKNGVKTDNSVMYMTCGLPCKDCMIELIQAGVRCLICNNTEIYDTLSYKIAEKSGMTVVVWDGKWFVLEEDKFIEKTEKETIDYMEMKEVKRNIK